MTEMKLYRKKVVYKDKNGEEKSAINFYLMLGNELVPIEVKYFADKVTKQDNQYSFRKRLVSNFADELPEKK